MTFAAIAQQLFGQRPFFLYCFERGGVEYRYTTTLYDQTIAVDGVYGNTWTASPIAHNRIPNSAESARAEFPISFPISDAFAVSCLAPIGINRVTVRVWRGYENDADAELIVQYTGALTNISPTKDKRIILTFVGDQIGLNRQGLAAVFQRPCRHVLYGRGCRLDLADFQIAASMTAITTSGTTLTVPVADTPADGYYNAGILSWGDYAEMILSHVGSTLILAAPIPGLIEAFAADGAQDVLIAPGCNLTTATCSSQFDNLLNFGGFPKISDTPFNGRSII